MEDLKPCKKVFSTLGWCYLVGTAVVYLLQIVLSLVVLKVKPEWLNSININLILSCVTTYGCGMPLIVLLARRLPAQPQQRHAMKWWQFVVAAIMCYSLMYSFALIGSIAVSLIETLKGDAVDNAIQEIAMNGNLFLNFFCMVVIAPIAEELVFRKVIVDRTAQYGQGMAIVMSGLMFGLFHGNLSQFSYALPLGMFLAFLYIKTGNIKITMGIHAVINFMGSVVATQILKLVHYDELMALQSAKIVPAKLLAVVSDQAASSADLSALMKELETSMGVSHEMMELIMDNLAGWMVFFVYAVFLFVIVITGWVLFLVFIKRFKLEEKPTDVPKGKRFQVMMLNSGMLTFCAVWLVLIVLQLFA